MGFYGNITNTSKTQFQFDKIYSSRYDMESQARTDGIYAGRYVLVEYDTELSQDSFYRVFINDDDGQMYNAPGVIADTNKISIGERLEFSDPNKGAVSVVPVGAFVFTADGDNITRKYTNIVYYKVTGDLYKQNKDNNRLLKGNYKQVTADNTISPDGIESTVSNYTKNYAIDNEKYGAGRGYDSTVWQKAYIDNIEKYIMIAELNSVVPTFGVSADAPTAEPIAPHFDTQSTDLYYKLHWQPAWGMRIAEGKLDEGQQKTTITSIDKNAGKYPSDEEVSYDNVKYYPENNTTETKKVSYNGAIYYNKAGFKDNIHTYYNGDGELKEDKISVKPTGVSHMKYHNHGNDIGVSEQPDIQEISIMLPSLGNALCDIWDKVYGYDPENDNLRYRDIEWKDAILTNDDENNSQEKFSGKATPLENAEKKGDASKGYMTRSPETIAGCINMAHDLMGMILTTSNIPLTDEGYLSNKIYYDKTNGKYYRVHRFPLYDIVDVKAITDLDESEYPSDQDYIQEFEKRVNAIIKSYKDEDWYLVIDSSKPNYQVKRFNKKALTQKALSNYNLAHIRRNPDDKIVYGYEKREIIGFADDLSTINGLILQLKYLIESDDSETRDRKTVQGTINVLNDIINIFEDLTPGEFLICDDQGHVNSAYWTTKQDFEYSNYGLKDKEKGEEPVTETITGVEDQWILLSIDEKVKDDGTIGIITLNHQFNGQSDTKSNSDKNNTSFNSGNTQTKDDTRSKDGINNDNNINTLQLYTPIVDSTGHIVGRNTETVTLPYGYKYLKTNGIINKEDSDLYTTFDKKTGTEYKPKPNEVTTEIDAKANSTQDQITINTGNKWIQTKIKDATNNDTIIIAHEVHNVDKDAIKDETNLNNLTPEEQKAGQDPNKIKIQDMSFDAAGHITANKAHTYVLPYGYKTIKTSNDDSSTIQIPNPLVTKDQIASNTQDTITIKGADSWIKVGSDDKTLSIYHNSPSGSNVTPTTGANSTTTKKQIEDTKGGIEEIVENTPKFGGTFDVPQISYDKAGHISSDTKYSIRLPAPSLVTAKNSDGTEEKLKGNVLIDLDLNSEEGIFIKKPAYVGTLTLTNYLKGTNGEAVLAGDSINQAFSKLQTHIESTDTNLNEEIKNRETAISTEVTNRDSAILKAIQGLDANGNLVANQTIGSWAEKDGVVSITPQQITITNANVDTNAAIDISKINIDDNTIAMSKINGLSSALDEKQPAGKYENAGAATEAATKVQDFLIGATDDSTDTLTLNGLLNRIKALEKKVEGLKGSTGA